MPAVCGPLLGNNCHIPPFLISMNNRFNYEICLMLFPKNVVYLTKRLFNDVQPCIYYMRISKMKGSKMAVIWVAKPFLCLGWSILCSCRNFAYFACYWEASRNVNERSQSVSQSVNSFDCDGSCVSSQHLRNIDLELEETRYWDAAVFIQKN